MATKWVYSFSPEKTEGSRELKNLLGGKGANLAEMSAIGIAVPPGFTLTTEACLEYGKLEDTFSDEMKEQVSMAIKAVEENTGKKFGNPKSPLLFSVRSGARVSMPGMMDTVLNLGLNEETVRGLAELTGNPRFAWDSYRRFIQMYANVVMGFNLSLLESTLEDLKEAREVELDTQLSAEDLEQLCSVYKDLINQESGQIFPNDPIDQLWLAIAAVFGSWKNSRAVTYRQLHDIPHDWGTAVNVQSMVYGNMGDDSATGVCFTRDPSTGDKRFFGEFLVNAQGEDVVAGIRTPHPINDESKNDSNNSLSTLKEVMPKAYEELVEVYTKLENHYRDMQDIEFTIEKDRLYLLQTRNGKRTTAAAIKIAVDLVSEGVLSKEEAIMRIVPEDLNQLLHPRLDPDFKKTVLTKGLPASPGAAGGEICFNSDCAHMKAENGKKVILVRQETSPEDISGMVASEGILTARGGMTSHAAVVARGMGKPCVAGCSDIKINYQTEEMLIKGRTYKNGDYITIDGATGEVIDGLVPTIPASIDENFSLFMSWVDEVKRLTIRTNADNPEDTIVALNFGADGIGLCRTEHMFFAPERILAVREMIFSETKADREKALVKILPFQREDFIGIFTALEGKPANIRLLDPPLHEFLPHTEPEMLQLAEYLNLELQEIQDRAEKLKEFNPMLGHRGCRLGITYPEVYQMQVRAIIEAALICQEKSIKVQPEIMIPLIALDSELVYLKEKALETIQDVFKETNQEVKFKIGTMIELPRAAICAGEIAPHADFFSFGTNDLTQTTFGLSRDDAGKFLGQYVEKGIIHVDPFVSLDQDGVGFLVAHACKEGRKKNKDIHLGICGEHGGDPRSIKFCHNIGLDYVSCSPYRVPVARLAAAQANIEQK